MPDCKVLEAGDDQVDALPDEGWRPAAVALLSTGSRHVCCTALIGDHGAPDVVGETSFQTLSCFSSCLALDDLGVVVGVAAAARGSDLGDRCRRS